MSKCRSVIKGVLLPVNEYIQLRWRAWREPFARLIYRGDELFCPVCTSSVKRFLGTGTIGICPVCRSAERSRLDWIYLQTKIGAYGGAKIRMLHVAPESYLEPRLRKMENIEYVSIDLSSSLAMIKMDITDIKFPENSFDLIYCSHVLEHVPDDRKAIAEFFRVLKPFGLALLQVPMSGETTFEDCTATSPDDRRELFGDPNHVRIYGADYEDRLREAGFMTSVLTALNLLPQSECKRMGVATTRRLFCGTKRC